MHVQFGDHRRRSSRRTLRSRRAPTGRTDVAAAVVAPVLLVLLAAAVKTGATQLRRDRLRCLHCCCFRHHHNYCCCYIFQLKWEQRTKDKQTRGRPARQHSPSHSGKRSEYLLVRHNRLCSRHGCRYLQGVCACCERVGGLVPGLTDTFFIYFMCD